MKSSMRRIAVLLVILAMMCSLFGCAESGTTDEPAASNPTPSDTTPPNADNGSHDDQEPGDTGSADGNGDEFVIGISVSYSGATAQYGLEAINGLDMALEYINANGGFNGAKGVKATLYDSKGSTEEAVKSAQKLTQNEKCNAVIASQVSSEVLASGNVYNDAKVFTVGMGTSATWMQQGWEYLIRSSVNYDFVAPNAVEMMKEMGLTKIAMMHDQSEASVSFKDTVVSICEEEGIDIIITESCEVEDTDMTSQCTRIINAGPQAVFISMSGNDIGYFVKQMRQFGYTGTFFDKESYYAAAVDIAGEENSNYIFFANPYVTYASIDDCDIPNMREFLENYVAAYGELPSTEIAYRAWDSAMVIWEASKLAGSNDGDAMLAVVPQIQIEGLGGPMDYSNNDGEPYHNVRRFVYVDGKNVDWATWMADGGYDAYKEATGNEY
ncbi:MAG: ABC transporter substrate-binding protein [Oscillospiraceae bacterium]|nr:ABC transporter substrate-binding protein [Oscillospiraceae bacterium]